MTRRGRKALWLLAGLAAALGLLAWGLSPLWSGPGYVLGFIVQSPRVFTGDMTSVAHSIRGRTFDIPRAYLPYSADHRPSSAEVEALIRIEAELPDLTPYAADPFDGNNRVLTLAELERYATISLSSIVYDNPISATYNMATARRERCRPDPQSGFLICPDRLTDDPIWIIEAGKARIGMTCGFGEIGPRTSCFVTAPLVQNVSVRVGFHHSHAPDALDIFAQAVDLVCSWRRSSASASSLTFNYCEEKIYAPHLFDQR